MSGPGGGRLPGEGRLPDEGRQPASWVIHCDNHVLVTVKPPNVPSQADVSGDPDMLSLMKAYVKNRFQKPGQVYLGLLHRLDRPVGGLMVFARTSKAAARLSAQFRERTIEKIYWAVVEGDAAEQQTITGEICHDQKPQEASLTYRRIEKQAGLSLLSVRLHTGRKHQIRIQLSEENLPIWGDARYGKGKSGMQIALFAAGLSFTHPTAGERLSFFQKPAPLPPWTFFDAYRGNAIE